MTFINFAFKICFPQSVRAFYQWLYWENTFNYVGQNCCIWDESKQLNVLGWMTFNQKRVSTEEPKVF